MLREKEEDKNEREVEEKENKRETREGWLVAIIEEEKKKEHVQSVCRFGLAQLWKLVSQHRDSRIHIDYARVTEDGHSYATPASTFCDFAGSPIAPIAGVEMVGGLCSSAAELACNAIMLALSCHHSTISSQFHCGDPFQTRSTPPTLLYWIAGVVRGLRCNGVKYGTLEIYSV